MVNYWSQHWAFALAWRVRPQSVANRSNWFTVVCNVCDPCLSLWTIWSTHKPTVVIFPTFYF